LLTDLLLFLRGHIDPFTTSIVRQRLPHTSGRSTAWRCQQMGQLLRANGPDVAGW
jgi:hypothetical protein